MTSRVAIAQLSAGRRLLNRQHLQEPDTRKKRRRSSTAQRGARIRAHARARERRLEAQQNQPRAAWRQEGLVPASISLGRAELEALN